MPVEDAIADIKKEIVESHNLIIKTDNLVKNLSADIRQVQKKQERYERKYIFNSVVAYVIFVVVIFGGLYVAFDAKVSTVRREKESLEEELAKAKIQVEEYQTKLAIRSRLERKTEQFLQLKESGKNLDALQVVEKLDAKHLSPVLARLVDKEAKDLRRRLAQEALDAGKVLYQKAHLSKAMRELDRALDAKPAADLAAKVHHQRALVLLKLNQNARAAKSFLAAVDADPTVSSADNLLFMAAGSLETSGDIPHALEVYERLLKHHAKSIYANQARRRIGRLTGKKATAPKPPAPAPAPAPRAEDATEKPKPE